MAEPKFRSSLAGRTVVALALFVGYYVLAIAVAGGLVVIPFAGIKLGLQAFALLILYLSCFVAAALILWSIVPRRERFEKPGLCLTRESDPRLFDEVTRIARKLGQRVPAEVYLLPAVAAWVGERGGFMGFGRRRIAGVGLPLLQGLSVGEFRAVLAHELGHFSRGDTKLGPWIYRTRAAIGRTLAKLPNLALFGRFASALGAVVQKPFVLYGNRFLRITQALSRRQEYVADEIAAATAGKETACSALRKTFTMDLALQMYWSNLMGPALNAGFLPPYAAGLARFAEGEAVRGDLAKALSWQIENAHSQPHDSHPSLGERLKALEALSAGPELRGGPPAVTLLENVPGRERELFAFMNPEAGPKLEPMDWDDVTDAVLIPYWAGITKTYEADLAGVTPRDLPDRLPGLAEWGRRMGGNLGPDVVDEQAKSYAAGIVGIAILTRSIERGWRASYVVGEYTRLQIGERSWEPFKSLYALAGGEMPPGEWLRLCEELGIGDLELGPAAPAEGREPSPEPARRAQATPAPASTSESPGRLPINPSYLIGLLVVLMFGAISLFRTYNPFWARPDFSTYRALSPSLSASGSRAGGAPGRPSTGRPLSFSLAAQGSGLTATVTKCSSGPRSYGATVEVLNRSGKTYDFVMVRIEFCDGAGRVVGALVTEGQRDEYIAPGGLRSFTVTRNGKLDFVTARASVAYFAEVK
jgi:heat shock protein HtpX